MNRPNGKLCSILDSKNKILTYIPLHIRVNTDKSETWSSARHHLLNIYSTVCKLRIMWPAWTIHKTQSRYGFLTHMTKLLCILHFTWTRPTSGTVLRQVEHCFLDSAESNWGLVLGQCCLYIQYGILNSINYYINLFIKTDVCNYNKKKNHFSNYIYKIIIYNK